MSKAASTPLRRLKEQLASVDVLFEVRDARLPISSRHPKSAELLGQKPRIIVLTKSDLADPRLVKDWITELKADTGYPAIALCLKTAKGQEKLLNIALEITVDKREALKRKGILPRPIRACAVGLPNVGKSSLINWLIGRKKAAVGNRPGITRGNSWIRVHSQLELLDTPGMLPNATFSPETSLLLALCNILPEDHYQIDETAEAGLTLLADNYPGSLSIYDSAENSSPIDLSQIARIRSCLLSGGKFDLHRAAGIFISDFRSGKLGSIVLDPLPIKKSHDE